MKRSYSNELNSMVRKTVLLKGWVNSCRDHGKIIFIDLRDMHGLTQIVISESDKEAYNTAKKLGPEYVVSIMGLVRERPEKLKNKNIISGEIEVDASNIQVLSEAKQLPFPIDQNTQNVNEELRLKYRYLDLRSYRMTQNIRKRNDVIQFMRKYLLDRDFVEIETPILTKSTPEGARDFVIPSRLHQGKFYSLPQSPQQYKMLLIVTGIEKYFQIARCFRDEDPRGDRQPEFTQLDLEMSFVTQEKILELTENLYIEMIKKLFPHKKISQTPFPKISYKDVMEKYHSDKPDLRKDKNNLNELAFAWIVDFPVFEWKKEENRWDAVHHPFTAPVEDWEIVKNNPDKAIAQQYDLVLNGFEIGGGSIRIHDPKLLMEVFKFMGNSEKVVREQFGHLLDAYEYGIPPLGGIASGIDRFLTIVQNEDSIREVIAFPKTGDSRDLMMDSPANITTEQKKELGLK